MKIVRCSEKNFIDLEDDIDSDIYINELILFGIGNAIHRINNLFNKTDIEVDLGNGIVFSIGSQDPLISWRERLLSILDFVYSIDLDNFNYDKAIENILLADGWSYNKKSLKTPVWMLDFEEIPLISVINDFEEMSWIVKYISETK